MEKKMFIYLEGLDSSGSDGLALGEMARVPSAEGIVSYQCKMYQTLLAQGTASRRSQLPVAASHNLLTIRLWGPSRTTTPKATQD